MTSVIMTSVIMTIVAASHNIVAEGDVHSCNEVLMRWQNRDDLKNSVC